MKYKTLFLPLTLFIILYIYLIKTNEIWQLPLLLTMVLCVFSSWQLWLVHKYRTETTAAKKDLIEKNQKLESVFNHSALGIMLADRNGKLLDANPKFLEMLGYSMEEIKTLSYIELTFPDDREKDMEHYALALQKKLPYSKEKRYIRKDGGMFIGKLSASFILDDKGFPIYTVAHVEDITKEKQLEDHLKESQKRYRDLVTYSPEPFLVQRDGMIIFANEKACKIVELSMTELLGKSIYDFIRPEFHHKTRKTLAELQNVYGEAENRPLEIITANGRRLIIEITLKVIDYEGAPSIQAIFRDVTERRRLEKELRKTTERYRFITENSKDIIAFLSPDGRYEYISDSCREILGFSPKELLGEISFHYVHEDDAAEMSSIIIGDKAGTSDHFSLLYRHKLKNGGYIWFETVAKLLLNEQGKAESILAISRDATKRKEKERSLETANDFLKMLSNLDGLTGIPNRRSFEETLDHEWQRCLASGTGLSAIMIDIDCFKEYNDTFGHLAGDDCLKEVASIIKGSVKRPRDFVARYGGEEFVVLLPDTDLAGSRKVAELIRHSVREKEISHTASQVDHFVTISAGYASLLPENSQSPKELLLEADSALYIAKRSGKNRACGIHEYSAHPKRITVN
ncbi:PAS domain S-box protein [Neobacillus notoginsengisoli]|uniref:PAS domain S-box protein n=1 Tax=Neobacillus notoginsengisoli TaxID=1578198 RepID=A0A417YQ13_9BACI|nr:PAS domain S-box protein [Neobacillus notoginsengisoli]RHW35678.1 PAS domain S-box protein [Neobacillus notoginsengisoli]